MSAAQNRRRSLRIYILAPVAVLAGVVTGGALHRAFPGNRSSSTAFTSGAGSAVGGSVDSQNPSAPLSPFSLEAFKAAPDQTMRRMLVQVLPKAHAPLMRQIADHLWDREPILCPGPVWKAVMSRWTQLDAPAALAWAQERDAKAAELKSEKERDSGSDEEKPECLTGTVLAAWAEQDPDSIWEVCFAGDDSPFRKLDSDSQTEVLEKLVKSDPARALKLSRTNGEDGKYWSNFDNAALQCWVRISPREALEYFTKEKPKAFDTKDTAACLTLGWASTDPAACAEWIVTLPLNDQHELLSSIPRQNSPEKPEKAARLLSLLPMSGALQEAGNYVAHAWAEKNPAEALAWVRTRFPEGPSRTEALASAAGALMDRNLRAAVAIMDEAGWRDWADSRAVRTPDSSRKQEGMAEEKTDTESPFGDSGIYLTGPAGTMGGLLARLAAEDPALGIQCFEKAKVNERESLLIRFASAWFEHEPEAAMRWLSTQPFAGNADPRKMLHYMGNMTPEVMRGWALRLPPGPLTTALTANYVRDTFFADSKTALAEIPFTDPANRQAAEDGILSQWAATSPAQALDHLLGEPAPRPELCQSMVRDWTRHDASAASAWVAALEPGTIRDAAITGLVTSLTAADQLPNASAALVWSLEIGDPVKRLAITRQMMKTWQGTSTEMEEARETLSAAAALSDDDRSSLLRLLPSSPP